MPDLPNVVSGPADFEFAALVEARRYRRAIAAEFAPYLRGAVIEIGAGIGQFTAELEQLPGVDRLVAVEPDVHFVEHHRALHPRHELVAGTIDAVPPDGSWDAIVSVNVLEHIEADATELAKYRALLAPRTGHLCLLVPARPEIYAPIDRDFGHFRRYTRPGLRRRLADAGFEIVALHYFNGIGYLAWWLTFCLFQQRRFRPRMVRMFDQLVFPICYTLERHLCRPPVGQSLLAVGRARPRSA